MNLQENILVYNQLDFIVKAPKFTISFSYTDGKGLSFMREYILRLLYLTACTREQIANYFGLNQKETEIALEDLFAKKWIEDSLMGQVQLSVEGLKLFQHGEGLPRLFSLHNKNIDCYMELVGENFLKNNINKNKKHAIELTPPHQILAESKKVVSRNFKNRFLELKEDGLVDLDNDKAEIYKIDDVNNFSNNSYFRFKQSFTLDYDGNQLDRNTIESVKDRDDLEQAVTKELMKFKNSNNIRDLMNSMGQIDDDETLKIIVDGKFNRIQYEAANNSLEEGKGGYFIGQTYHQKIIESTLDKIFKDLKKEITQPPKKLFWMAPSDIYWGAQEDVQNLLNLLSENATFQENNEKKRLYDFRLYLPLESSRDKHAKNRWLYEFNNGEIKSSLYGFKEGFLNGNTEIIILESHFLGICYHAKLPQYDVTLPIGFFTCVPEKVNTVFQLINGYLSSIKYEEDENKNINDYGKLVAL